MIRIDFEKKLELFNHSKSFLRLATKVEKKDFKASHFEMHYLCLGQQNNRPTLVFIHGFSDMPETFIPIALKFRSRFNIIIPALPGFDDKRIVEGKSYSLENYVSNMIELLEENATGDLHLVGNSLGGAISVSIAHALPDRVKSLVLLNAAGAQANSVKTVVDEYIEGKNPFKVTNRDEFNHFLKQIFYRKPKTFKSVEKFFFQDMKSKSDDFEKIADDLFQSSPAFIKGEDIVDFSKIKAKTKVIWGIEDKFFPVEVAHAFCERIPGATLKQLKNTGHCPHLESPIKLVRELNSFYKTLK